MDDLISRQAVIDEANAWLLDCFKVGKQDKSCGLIRRLEDLPSAQPKRKGYWIEMGTNKDGTHSIRCSKCGECYKTRGYAWSITTKAKYKFCPNCGADMRDEQEK